MGKGASQIATAALYIGITIAAITVAINVGAPMLEDMRDAAAIRKARSFMQQVDSDIQQIVSEGEGSSRSENVQFDRGKVYYQNETDSLIYELKTDAAVISPQSARQFGNVILSSNAEVTVEEATVDGVNCYLMRNDHIAACVRNVGNSSHPQSINTSELLVEYNFTDPDPDRQYEGDLTVELNGIYNTSHGMGYTEADELGDYIGTGKVRARVQSDFGYNYDLVFALPTGSDFLQVNVKNFG